MVASASPYASDAGLEMLRRGGNAIDAAVATAFAVGVVEPMMAGIGGGGAMLLWTQKDRRAEYLDFYPNAGADPDTAGARVLASHPARATAVPGSVAGLLDAHQRYGKLSRDEVLAPAIRLAEGGFPVHSLLARAVTSDSAKLARYEGARRIFLPGGRPIAAGERLVQPELAATLRAIAAEGAQAFHEGPIAAEIVNMLSDGGNTITAADFAAYTPRWRRPLCTTYRGRAILSAPPPQSGMQVLEALNLLESRPLPTHGLPSRSPEAFRIFAAALRVSVADRNAFVGDPDRVAVPAAGLSSPAFAARRVALLDSTSIPPTLAPGNPWSDDSASTATGACARVEPYGSAAGATRVSALDGDESGTQAETTHLSAVDAEGNAVSLTFTNGVMFGSGAWAAGAFFNSAMANFSGNPASPNARGASHVPASTIAPTIVLKDERAELVVGSPGSAAIPPAIIGTIVYTLDYGLDPLHALRMPRVIPTTSARLRLEDGFSPEVIEAARRLGYDVQPLPPVDQAFGGVHVIRRVGSRWVGAADPRRNGEVRGY
jgi:gamma-glutamyltranspeptidase/glutathione hydrolase